jgi:molybdopterin synthase catalytic subunit
METHIAFTTQPIIVPAAQTATRETGAEVEFRGIVRETEQGRAIGGLNYEAHIPMATRHLHRILDKLRETWPCQAVWFIHRLGWVPVGETSLYVRVQASHREAAFRFCMELINLLKKDAPIWKLTAPPPPAAATPSPPVSE